MCSCHKLIDLPVTKGIVAVFQGAKNVHICVSINLLPSHLNTKSTKFVSWSKDW